MDANLPARQTSRKFIRHRINFSYGDRVGAGMMPSSTMAATRESRNYLGSYKGAMAQSPAEAFWDSPRRP